MPFFLLGGGLSFGRERAHYSRRSRSMQRVGQRRARSSSACATRLTFISSERSLSAVSVQPVHERRGVKTYVSLRPMLGGVAVCECVSCCPSTQCIKNVYTCLAWRCHDSMRPWPKAAGTVVIFVSVCLCTYKVWRGVPIR